MINKFLTHWFTLKMEMGNYKKKIHTQNITKLSKTDSVYYSPFCCFLILFGRCHLFPISPKFRHELDEFAFTVKRFMIKQPYLYISIPIHTIQTLLDSPLN